MSDAPFVHLHLHSEYSLLDGGNRVRPLVERIRDLGMDAVALTDHGNLFGAIDFYTACKSIGVKPILGIEAYVAPDVNTEKSDRRHKESQGVADGGFHLVLLAESATGWQNLMKLSSDAFVEGFYYKPRMDKETLERWSDGLIAINGHLGSSIAYHLGQFERTGADEHWQRARNEALWHAATFAGNDGGEPRFYLELQRHDTPEQEAVNGHVVRLAEELDLPLVCDNDAHFLGAEDWDAHDTLVCVSTGKSKGEVNRLRYPQELYVKAPEAMSTLFNDIPEALRNTSRIAERCNVELDFSANHAPLVGVERRSPETLAEEPPRGSTEWYKRFCSSYELMPIDSTTDDGGAAAVDSAGLKERSDQALRELAEAGLVWRYGETVTEEHRARLDRELKVLADKNISAYFLIVWDFVNEARNRGIPAMARGSGVGTMVGYCLGLSNACPVQYGLLFERFTDPDRSEYPDIDIDLCQDGRAEILDYVRDKYGYVAQIITFGTMKARAAIRDVGRVHELPLGDVDRICKLIGDQLGVTLREALDREPELKAMYEERTDVKAVIDTAMSLEGIVRHSGVHAAGVVIATEPLENLVPLALAKPSDRSAKNGKNGRNGKNGKSADDRSVLVTQWDGPTVEKLGLLKMDFLGLKTLSVLERARQLVAQTLDSETIKRTTQSSGDAGTNPLDLDRIDFRDQEVLDLYRRGETIGTFQFESDGMRNLLLKMRPDRLEDLVAANALFRPGPMALIDDYCDRKHGRQRVPEVHEIVDRHTADTYGIMVYQEQVMQIAHELGGIALREAYSLIKAISKKKSSVINAARERFVAGAAERGLEPKKSNELFDLILRFAGYGFNKSHSVGYSILAYQTAYLKTYFPIQFMAAVLTYESDNTDKLALYLDECKRARLPNGDRGADVLPPDINASGVRFQVVFEDDEPRDASHGHIRFGLSAVKGVGGRAVEAILEARREGGPFADLFDFCERVSLGAVNRSTIEALIRAGAFDSIHGADKRAALVEALDGAIRGGQRVAADRESGQTSLFGGEEPMAAPEEPTLPDVPPWTVHEQLQHEKAALGFYASRHPLDEHRELLERFSSARIADLGELAADTEVTLGAMISNLRVTRTKKGRNPGQKMGLLTLEDGSGKVEAVVFSELFAAAESSLEEDAILFFEGKVDRRREEPGLIVGRIIALDQAESQLARRLRIVLDCRHEPEPGSEAARSLSDRLERLREALDRGKRQTNGSQTADVVVEAQLEGGSVTILLNSLRIPIAGACERLEPLLGTGGRCQFEAVRPTRPPVRREVDDGAVSSPPPVIPLPALESAQVH